MDAYELSRNVTAEYNHFMNAAANQYRKADWEEMNKALQRAKECCDEPGFPDRTRSKQKAFEQYGTLMRRWARYKDSAIILETALKLDVEDDNDSFEQILAAADKESIGTILENPEKLGLSNNLERLSVLGELGTAYRHMGDSTNASRAFNLHHRLASRLLWQAEAETCRAIGNVGMVKYDMVMRNETIDSNDQLLSEAIRDIEERVSSAQALQNKLALLEGDEEAQKLRNRVHQWEAIGVVRLVLCYVAKNQLQKALEYGELGTEVCRSLTDPTSRAHGRFYHGYALWHNDRKDEARQFFSFWSTDHDLDKCTPAIAFCKEPSEEYRRYLRLLVEADVEMLHIDEQGYSALDYAVFARDEEAANIVMSSFKSAPEEGARLRYQAELRRNYRVVLQEHFRPAFSSGGDLVRVVKEEYASLLDRQLEMAKKFSRFKYVMFSDFKKHKKLPTYYETDIIQEYRGGKGPGEDVMVAFVSYRWIGAPGSGQPDNVRNTQYRRMCDALERLKKAEGIPEHRLGVWLDVACIDQTDKGPGIAALPLSVVQCNYMVSLVDTTGEFLYYTRAWCCAEALLMETLETSYRRHRRYEHLLINPKSSEGKLVDARRVGDLKPSEQGLSVAADKPQIQFLERQTRLLDKK